MTWKKIWSTTRLVTVRVGCCLSFLGPMDPRRKTPFPSRWTLCRRSSWLDRPRQNYFSHAIASHLNTLLRPQEGQAITRSLDDYYLTHAERYRPEFLSRGYNPSGISNRGPAGTHDLKRFRTPMISRLWKRAVHIHRSSNACVRQANADDRSSESLWGAGKKLAVLFLMAGLSAPIQMWSRRKCSGVSNDRSRRALRKSMRPIL